MRSRVDKGKAPWMADDLSIQETAALLGISEQAVHKRIRSPTLAATKQNKRWLVDGDSARAALASPPRAGRPATGISYMLMNGPYEVMEFTYQPERESFRPTSVFDAARAPLGTVSRNGRGRAEGLRAWWEHRSIPDSRAGMDARLRVLGLSDPAQIPFRNLGFSLSDQYWIRPVGEDLRWEDLNYFQHEFGDAGQAWDEWLSDVGLSSPDNTSEGVLPKRWLCEGAGRFLLKGHIPWTDQQVYNEVVATRLYRRLLDRSEFVPYEVRRAGNLGVVSQCACFLAPDEEYVPISLAIDSEGPRPGETTYDTVLRVCANLGIPRVRARQFLSKMIVCDSILANTDRHLRNFGLIRNIHDLTWRFAPLFDTGNSLWYDKDESAVARGDYTFVSRPFDVTPNRQLLYAEALEWLDLSCLEGFPEEACEILAEGDLSRWRIDYLREGIARRITAVQELCGSQSMPSFTPPTL